MFIPLDQAAGAVQEVGGISGIAALLLVTIREALVAYNRRKIKKDIEQVRNGNPGSKNPGNPVRNNTSNGSSSMNMLLDMIKETHEIQKEFGERLRSLEIGFASLQATCKARHEKDSK